MSRVFWICIRINSVLLDLVLYENSCISVEREKRKEREREREKRKREKKKERKKKKIALPPSLRGGKQVLAVKRDLGRDLGKDLGGKC